MDVDEDDLFGDSGSDNEQVQEPENPIEEDLFGQETEEEQE